MLSRFSRGLLFATSWTVANRAPPSMGFSRQEYWSGLPFPPPGDLLDPGIEPASPVWQADPFSSLSLQYQRLPVEMKRWGSELYVACLGQLATVTVSGCQDFLLLATNCPQKVSVKRC